MCWVLTSGPPLPTKRSIEVSTGMSARVILAGKLQREKTIWWDRLGNILLDHTDFLLTMYN